MVSAQVATSLSIVVMAHPRRRKMAQSLVREIGDTHVIFDTRDEGEWINGSRAWRFGADLPGTHVLVLQDDAIPVPDLRHEVHKAIDAAPDSPISLYLGTKKPSRWRQNVEVAVSKADIEKPTFLRASHLLHGVGIVLPKKWITPMLQWAELTEVSTTPYDQRIGLYLRASRAKPTLYTWPSLVDHAPVPSLVEHADDARLSTDGRVAYRVGPIETTLGWPTIIDIETPMGAGS